MLRDIGTITMLHLDPLAIFLSVRSAQSWMALVWILAGAWITVHAIRRKRPWILVAFGGIAIAAAWVSSRQALWLELVLLPAGALLAAAGIVLLVWRSTRTPQPA